MANETVTLTAELKDQMSAPLAAAEKKVAGFTKTVEEGSRKQAAAVTKSTNAIDGDLKKQNRLFSGMGGPIGRATDGAARMFGTMRSKIKTALDGLPEYSRRQGEKTANGFGDGLKKAGALVATYFGAQMVGGFIAEAGRASDATDKFKSTMSFAGLDTSAITQATADAKAFADQTVYDLPTIQKTMATLAANGVKDYSAITKAAGNLNAVAGGNAETFKSVSLALGQSAGAGKLMAEDWNMLADAIPGASGQLQKAMRNAGAFEGNFKKAMENGEITAEEFQAAIMTLGNQPIAEEAAKSTKTFEGALGNLNATINSGLMKALDKIKPAATVAIGALSNGLGKAMEWTGNAAQGLYDLFVKGDFSGAFAKAFNVEEDNPVVDLLFDIREGAIGLYDLIVKGDYQGMLKSAFGWEEDSKAVDMLLKLRDAAIKLPDKLKAVADKIVEWKDPITVVAGLILTLLIPRFVQMGIEAMKAAVKTRIAWAMTQGAAVKASAMNVIAAWQIIGGWVLMATAATVNAVKIAASWLVAMGPVGWIIGIVALLVGAFIWAYNNVEWFRDGVDAAMKWVGDAVKTATDWIVGAWNNVVDWWNTTLLPAIDAVGQWFEDVFANIGTFLGDTFANIGNWFRDFIGFFVDGWGMMVDFFNGVLMPAVKAVGDFFAPVFDWISRLVWNLTTIAVFLFHKLVDFWNGVLFPAIQALGKWFGDVAANIVLGFQTLANFISSIFTWIWTFAIKPVVDFIVGAFNNLISFWNTIIIPGMQSFGNFIGQIFNWIWTTLIKPVIDFIVNGFVGLVNFWNGVLIPAFQAVGNFIGTVMNWIYTTLIQPVIDLIVGAFRGLTDFWNNTLMPAAKAVGDWFSVTIGGAINGVKSFIDDLIKNFQGFMSFVGDKLQPVIDGIKGAFDAVAGAIETVLGKIGEFANNPLGGIQDMLGIAKDDNGQGIMPQNSGGGVYPGNGVMFAGGGVLGGYAPGRDVIPALLSPGESVLVPELTRAIGPSNIMAANAAASGGRPAGSGPALTSGYSSAGRGGGSTTIVAEGAVQIVINTQGERVSETDIDAIRDAVNEIFRNENRSY